MRVQSVNLSDIDLSKFQFVKESLSVIDGNDHSRWVFRQSIDNGDEKGRTDYVKIWNPRHVRRNAILEALDVGFYDESTASALSALVFHAGVCRGYVTHECDLAYRDDDDFFCAIKDKTADTGYFAIQFSSNHAGTYNGRYSLFDLEGVHPIRDLPTMPSLRAVFDHPEYCRFVTALFQERFHLQKSDIRYQDLLPREGALKREIRRWKNSFWLSRRLSAFQWEARQRSKARRRAPSTHLIEY
jgi:hypothetical protein